MHLIERGALEKARADGYQLALEEQNKAVRDYEQRLKQRRLAQKEISDELSLWKQRWKDIQEQPVVQEWVYSHVPDAVREQLRELTTPPEGYETQRRTFMESDAVAYLF